MPKTPLQPSSVAVPKNPYSPGVKQGRFVFTSGQIPLDTRGNLVGLGDVSAQTDQVMKNVQAVLAEGGAMMEDVVKCTVFLADIRNFQAMNEVYAKYFPGSNKPSRSTVQATLARPDILVEIEAIAVLDE